MQGGTRATRAMPAALLFVLLAGTALGLDSTEVYELSAGELEDLRGLDFPFQVKGAEQAPGIDAVNGCAGGRCPGARAGKAQWRPEAPCSKLGRRVCDINHGGMVQVMKVRWSLWETVVMTTRRR